MIFPILQGFRRRVATGRDHPMVTNAGSPRKWGSNSHRQQPIAPEKFPLISEHLRPWARLGGNFYHVDSENSGITAT
jgi:hypothetical protein